jgi:3-hydroxyisobutyrate dehydrogenase-like beta-hydroxyacid dehydrogenase
MVNTKLGWEVEGGRGIGEMRVDLADSPDSLDSPGGQEGPGIGAVGVVGLGAMGSAIAGRLLDLGHEVHGTNRTAARAEPLVGRGLRWHDTPRQVAEAVEVVVSMVTDDAALRAVAAGPSGIVAGLRVGQVYVDMSSVSPQASVELGWLVSARSAHLLDAPVSGSIPQVQQGTLAIMVGGDVDVFQRTEPLLRQLGQTVSRVGDNGKGVLLKLAINISLAVQTLAFSEGLLLAERGGIPAQEAARVMSTSSIGSPMLRSRLPLLLILPETSWFSVRLMRKDIQLALTEAERLAVPLPSAAAVEAMLDTATDMGYGDLDLAALHQVLATIDPRPAGPASLAEVA